LKLKADDIIHPEHEAHVCYHRILRYYTIMHDHDFYEFFLILSGSVIHIVNGIKQVLQPGSLVFIRPTDQHSYERYNNEEVEILNINFRISVIEETLRYLGSGFRAERLLEPAHPPMKQIAKSGMQSIVQLSENILSLPPNQVQEYRSACRWLLVQFFMEQFGPGMGRKPTQGPKWLEKLQTDMKRADCFVEGVAAIYRLSPVSPEHLCRTIKQHFGCTPTEWVNDLRLSYAAELLRSGDNKIVHICMECGFHNLSHFYSCFKKRYKMTPAQFRRENAKSLIP
jgi:AraC family transcriptional regulator, dual regulator of chb operon